MENQPQQELLLVVNAGYFRKDVCKLRPDNSRHAVSASEKLEEGCWNGLLEDWLPGML